MEKYLSEIINFWTCPGPYRMSPAASWLMIGLMIGLPIAVVYCIRELVITMQDARANYREIGFCGILYAIVGARVTAIRRERVISASKASDGKYNVVTTNGERQGLSVVIPSAEDDTEEYRIAEWLSKSDPDVFDKLCPNARIRSSARIKSADDSTEIFVVYIRHENTADIEQLLQKEFDRRYDDELFHAKYHHRKVAA